MGKTLCIPLLTLAAVVLFFASEGFSRELSCCEKVFTFKKQWPIKECYEQKPREGCKLHAYVIITDSGSKCLNPNTPWLKEEIHQGKLKCPPVISGTHIFEVLDEDDVE